VCHLAYNGDVVAFKKGRRLGKRVGGSAYWRIGVWGSKTAFRHGYNDQEVSTELMMKKSKFQAHSQTESTGPAEPAA
jgi:hypothetical protein